MPTERERIEALLTQGKISPEEAARLRSALEKAERDDGVRSADGTDSVDRPRLSWLALSGALGLPAALVVGLLVAGLAMAFASNTHRAYDAAGLVASAVVLVGVGLSAAGLISIRRSEGKYTGRNLAHVGIWLPIGAALVVTTVSAIRDYMLEAELARQGRAEIVQLTKESEGLRVREVWDRAFLVFRQCRLAPLAERPSKFAALATEFLEPDWRIGLADKDGAAVSIEDTLQFRRILEADGPLGDVQERLLVVGVRVDEQTLEGLDATLWVTCGQERHVFSLKQIEDEWYFTGTW